MPPFLSWCEWFLSTQQSSVPTTRIHPFETGCMFSRGPDLSAEVSPPILCGNDTRCHCKKRHVLSCKVIKQTFGVSVEETSRAAVPVWRVNLLPPTGIFKPPSVIPPADFSSSARCKRTTNHFSRHPIKYWLLVCIITFLQQSWNEWQGTLPITRGQHLHCCQCPHLAIATSWKTHFGHNTCTKLEKNTNVRKHSTHRQHNPVHTPCHITNS